MGSFRSFVEQNLGILPLFLIYAVLEWVVIILLFVDGFLAFLSNEIARFFELRIPCLLCTRIDHILVHRDSNFYYNDSICDFHKKDISTLAYCHVHKKLSDIRSMCQRCLLSFATEKDSDVDKYKSLVGILHKDIDYLVEDEKKLLLKPLKNDDAEIMCDDERIEMLKCSCCGDHLKSKSKFSRSLSMNAPAPSPSPRAAWMLPGRNEEGGTMDLPNARYTELKLMSDPESELPEDEDASHAHNHAIAGREDVKAATVALLPDSEDMNEDATRTPTFTRGNKFFGIPLSDTAPLSPRWANNTAPLSPRWANNTAPLSPRWANNTAPLSPRWANRGSKKLPSDKLDLLMEPIDGNDADGDILTRLKRQLRLERSSLMALYMELDEERSASAIAANNAMAMITRLQAEKAAVQMEALQYQRMMEEQAEYDQEALQLMKDLLFKREEEIKALESELEAYREKYGHIKKIGSEICEVDIDEDYQDMHSQALSPFSEKSDGGSPIGADQNEHEHPYEHSMEYGGGNPHEPSLDLDVERSYLVGLLRNLEEKINGPSDEMSTSSEFVMVNDGNEGNEANEGNKAVLTREVSLIRERLRAIEAESGFLKHAAMTLQRGDEGKKLLTEIAQHLRELRHPVKYPSGDIEVI